MDAMSLSLSSTAVNWAAGQPNFIPIINSSNPSSSSLVQSKIHHHHHHHHQLCCNSKTKPFLVFLPSTSSRTRTVTLSLNNASSSSSSSSSWEDKPFQVLPNGRIAYLDEQDVVTFLDPPKHLIPLHPSSYNPASYLWKKIEDIPEERRHRLLRLLNPRLISRAWEIAGTRYDDPKLAVKSASNLFSNGNDEMLPEFWKCRTSGGPPPIAWMNFFRKALFYSKERKLYGRFIGGSLVEGVSNSLAPLYFCVREANEVMSTEQPCDLAYEFGDGVLDLADDYPQGFPKPGKHPWPFNDQVIVYIRHVGPGVLVGQAWHEGLEFEQLPKKLFRGDILMVKCEEISEFTGQATPAQTLVNTLLPGTGQGP